jgi:predicted lipid carrier protein YhbT
MNERIKELALQAEFFKRDLQIQGDNFQRFAELIVRECLDIVNRHEYSYHEADPLWETAQLIKERFGVAE